MAEKMLIERVDMLECNHVKMAECMGLMFMWQGRIEKKHLQYDKYLVDRKKILERAKKMRRAKRLKAQKRVVVAGTEN